MKYRKNLPFTLIEILIVAGIIMILAGFLLPAMYQAKLRAKYMRWFAYNNSLNRDPQLIINFNYHERGFGIEGKEVVHNGGEGCTIDGYKPKEYHGKINDYPIWLNRGGRWRIHNKTMMFDGADDNIEVEGTEVFNISSGDSDFTAICWVNFDELSGIQTLVSKSIWPNYAQFIIYAQGDRIKVETPNANLEYSGPDFRANKWTQVAVISKSGEIVLYIDGEQKDTSGNGGRGKIVIWHVPPGNPEAGRVLVIGAAGWNGHKRRAPDSYIISTDPEEYFNSNYTNEILNSKFLIGAANYLDATKNDFFKGKMDEVIYIKRGLANSEVKANYEMGNPY